MRKVSLYTILMLSLLFISCLMAGASSSARLSTQQIENVIHVDNNVTRALSLPIEGNWLNGWTWRKSHCINNATGAGSDFQIQITVVNGTCTDLGGTVYVNGRCQADFGDIRFTGGDGVTLQDYWLESMYEGENATFWVKVSADLSSASQNIYVYYGNSAVSSTSSFDNTFIFGDPFDNSSLDTSRWTAVDGVTAYSVNPTEHYLEVTNMTPNQGTGVGFHSRIFSMPSNWIVQDAYSDEGFVMYHDSKVPSDMFGQLVSLQNSTNVGSHGGVAYVMVHDGWVADSEVSDSAKIGSDSWDSGYWLPPMPYTTRWTMKRASDGLITLTQNGVDRIARINNDTIDRMTWELERYDYPGAGFGTERLYAFMVRKYVNPEPSHGSWESEERKITVPDDYPTIQEAINAASDGDTIFVRNGTYSGPIVVDKSLTLEGENRDATLINGGSNEPSGSIVLVTADNVKITGFTIQHCRGGGNAISLTNHVNMTFSDNIITGCNEGVRIIYSSGNVVSNNIVQGCYYNTGLGFDWAFNNTVYNNTLINNHYGISGGYDCYNNTYSENTFVNNDVGFGTNVHDSKFFHNNFVNNSVHVIANGVNQFDDGYPSGGNYWSDYAGADLFSGPYQNETGSDGIGDTSYTIGANNTDNYPLMNPWSPPDISVANLTSAKTVIGQGYTGSINVKFENLGNKIEAFNATVYANSICIYSEQTMLAMTNCTLSFTWNTTGLAYGNYTLSACAEPVSDETNIANNNFTGDWVVVAGAGDLTGGTPNAYDFVPDGKVDITDVAVVARYFSQKVPPAPANCDVSGIVIGLSDGKIDITDVATVAKQYGEHYRARALTSALSCCIIYRI